MKTETTVWQTTVYDMFIKHEKNTVTSRWEYWSVHEEEHSCMFKHFICKFMKIAYLQ